MKPDHFLAFIIVCGVLAFVFLAAAFAWENRTVDIALGALLIKLGDIVQFYFRKRPRPPARRPADRRAGSL